MGLISPFGAGFEQDLLARFAEDYGFTIQNREVAGFAEAYALLKAGKVDLIVGFEGDEAVTDDEDLASSPGYRQNHAVLLSTRRGSAAQGVLVSDPGLVNALPGAGKQAEADKVVAQAKAEMRRAAAVATEQEMKARTQEMQAKVVEAEAQVPQAMAEAFRSGNLGIMDYMRMKNLQSDTSMRETIANPGSSKPA